MHSTHKPRTVASLAKLALLPLFEALTGYMGRTGLIQYATDPGAGDVGDTTSLMAGDANPAAGGAPAAAQPADTGAPAGATGEAKPADGEAQPAAGEAKPGEAKPDDKPASKAPEKYEFKPPEGFALDEALTAEFTPVLRDLDLTQEQADKLVAFAPKLVEPAVDAAVATTLESLGYAGCKDWQTAAKADKEFGGEKLAENLAVIKAARDQFASPELRKMLEGTVLGNNPEMLRLFYRIGKQITPDGYVPGGKATGATGDARSMYAKSNMNP